MTFQSIPFYSIRLYLHTTLTLTSADLSIFHSFIRSFVYSFVHSFVYSFVRSFCDTIPSYPIPSHPIQVGREGKGREDDRGGDGMSKRESEKRFTTCKSNQTLQVCFALL